jgi:uncharacterized delta-60 repeat protein
MLCKLSRPLALILVFLFLSAKPARAQQTDQTFGANGFVMTNYANPAPVGSPFETAVKAFYLPDGKILTVVYHIEGVKQTFYALQLLRYSQNGTLEATIASVGNFVPTDAAQQADGKIIVAGYRYGFTNPSAAKDWIIARFNADGSLDASFNSSGIVTRGFAGNEDTINSVALQTDGKIVVLGTSQNNSNGIVTVIGRFNSDGSIDASFGPYGAGFLDIYDSGTQSKKILVSGDGKILIFGTVAANQNQTADLILSRYHNNGTIDPSFGNQGAKIIDYGAHESLADAALQADGKIVLLANSEFLVSGSTNYREREIIVARLNADGAPDASFGGGKTVLNTSPPSALTASGSSVNYQPTGDEKAQNILVEPNGELVISAVSLQLVVSRRSSPSFFGRLERKAAIMLFRLNSAGQITARNFTRRTPENQAVSAYVSVFGLPFALNGILAQPDGKLLTYGWVNALNFNFPTNNNDAAIALARYASISAVTDANNFFDYNFDGKAEFAVFRPNGSGLGTWFFMRSHTAGGVNYDVISYQYGLNGDIITPGDYDGDGLQDLAVFRPATGEWITRKLYLDNCAPMDCAETIQFGANGDIPAPGDFDGDGKTDRAVFRPSEGNWYILFSTGGYTGFHFGVNGDKPVVGDYDGDGKSDIAVIRRQNGKIFWYLVQSSDNQFVALQFGDSEDKTVVADYTGDGKTEIAVWRPSNGTWYLLANYTDFSYFQLGASGDIPEPADFDGDRKADFVVFTPATGLHSVIRSYDGNAAGAQFGLAADIPVASAYVR